MPDLDAVSGKVHSAIATAISEEKSAMVTKWVALVEVIDEDGGKAMWSLSSDDLAMWDRLGMVEFHSRLINPMLDDD